MLRRISQRNSKPAVAKRTTLPTILPVMIVLLVDLPLLVGDGAGKRFMLEFVGSDNDRIVDSVTTGIGKLER